MELGFGLGFESGLGLGLGFGLGFGMQSVFQLEHPERTRPGQFVSDLTPGQKCPRPKARLFLRTPSPFHATLLGATP